MEDLKQILHELLTKVKEIADKMDIPQKRARTAELQQQTLGTDFWKDDVHAKTVMQEIASLEEDVNQIEGLGQRIREQLDLIEMIEESDVEAMRADMEQAVREIRKDFKTAETRLFLNGKYDSANAILSIHAGQGGTEAQDWAGMLYRMYTRLFERRGWKYEQVDESRGEEAGIKSVTVLVHGKLAYGYLKRESGTHRLVRQSPFNADNLRQTSFALVEVLPELEESGEITIKDEELEWAFFRAGGHGGQNVNKVNTAVRLRHLPSGIVVEARTERYQEQNRKMALSLLTAKLWQIKEQEREKEVSSLKGQKVATWGMQIRNYVLHPYQLVKDVRTEVETSDTQGVLDGDLDQFIEAEIQL